ncbi:hypothetical protein [Spiroplasma culicicola]|uniref:Outer membrane protein beta-barrel domain-containing protein n=1 Tax=Spiroplasma culicicola AES-1 TaxID=1276246 RepID=W6A6C6_9MOLU|nr:hypothetical protein [Spiroplasma culicicola]AHI52547.1 hypothetical protein SCULI_v1c02060 [Spiroplasma culicicola AES-1]
MKKLLSIFSSLCLLGMSSNIQAYSFQEKNSIYDIEYSLDYSVSKDLETYAYRKNNQKWQSVESGAFFLFNVNELNRHVTWDILYNNTVKMVFQGYLKVRIGGTGAIENIKYSGDLAVKKSKDEIQGKINLYEYSKEGLAMQEVGAGIEYSIDKNLDLYVSTYAYAGSYWATSSCEANAFITDIRITTILY